MTSSSLITAGTVPLTRETGERDQQIAPISFSVVLSLMMGTLLVAPLMFGSVETWTWTALAVMVALLLLGWAVGNIRRQKLRVYGSPLCLPAILFLLLGFIQYTAHSTFDSYATWESLIQFATDLGFFFLAGQLLASAPVRTWNRIGLVVTLYAFSLAMFATVQFFSSHGLIYWTVKTHGWVFGPYVNHNDYAGLLEMLIPISAGYVLSLPAGVGTRRILSFAVLVSACSVLLSGSRGGLIAILIEGLIFAAVLWKKAAPLNRKKYHTMMIIGIGMIALLFAWVAPARISRRLGTSAGLADSPEVTLGERWAVWKDSLKIVRDHMLVGTGLGSYEVVFPQYQSFASNVVWDHAHNDYIEALVDSGLIGGVLVIVALGLFSRLAFGKLHRRLRLPYGMIQLGAGIGCCGLLVHSLSDFNLHIPANAAWFAFCLGLSTICVHSN